MKTLVYLLLLYGFCFSQLKYLKNDPGDVFYISLQKSSFLTELTNLKQHRVKLQTLIVSNVGKRYRSERRAVLELIKEQNETLETLVVRSCAFSMSELIDLLESFGSESNLKYFIWENQDDLDDEDLKPKFISLSHIWKNLEYLSFKETELDNEETFFLNEIMFPNLIELDLSDTDLDENGFTRLVNASKNYPQLKKLTLNNLDINEAKTDSSFDKLVNVSLFDSDVQNRNIKPFINNNKTMFSTVTRLVLNSLSMGRNVSDERNRVYETYRDELLVSFRTPNVKLLEQNFPKITDYGLFYSPSEKIGVKYKGLVLMNSNDVELYVKQKNNFTFKSITFFGSEISKYDVEYVLKEMKIKKIELAYTSIDPKDVETLKKTYNKTNFTHITLYDPDKRGHYNDFLQQMMHRQMMQDMMKHNFKPPVINVPRF